jgi:hypothetical protein
MFRFGVPGIFLGVEGCTIVVRRLCMGSTVGCSGVNSRLLASVFASVRNRSIEPEPDPVFEMEDSTDLVVLPLELVWPMDTKSWSINSFACSVKAVDFARDALSESSYREI